jgi:hypothetical protein
VITRSDEVAGGVTHGYLATMFTLRAAAAAASALAIAGGGQATRER